MSDSMISSSSPGAFLIDPPVYSDMDEWHRRATALRRDAPVSLVEADGWAPFWAVTGHPEVLEVSRRSDLYWNTPRSTPGPELQYDMLDALGVKPRTLVQLHGPEHIKHRQVTNEWFKPAAVKNLQPAIDTIATEFADRLADFGGSCDFAQDIAVPFTLRVIMSIFGVPESDESLMLELTQGLFGAADPEYLGDLSDPFQMVVNSIEKFETYFDAIAADRRAHPTSDLATVIANGTVDGEPMGKDHRFWYYVIVATAGHDTTSYGLSGGLAELLRNPDQVRALRDRPELVTNATEEMIRWTSPVRSFMRWVQEDTELGGVALSKGDQVLTSYPSANRDERVFDNALDFDIERADVDKLLSFGLGVHYCLGAQVARREIRTMLAKVMERTTTLELAADPQYSSAHFVSGVKHLPVTYTLR